MDRKHRQRDMIYENSSSYNETKRNYNKNNNNNNSSE